ncbi:MAG: hypothetical protein LBM00_06430 [Deltaproteobacteria bacterium]|jgi:hypothetical protein|nr:hypothetical protein [Deltaproteobacteria bacterium]
MKKALFLMMIMFILISIGCTNRTVIVNHQKSVQSEYIVKGDGEEILDKLSKKFHECYSGNMTTNVGLNHVTIASHLIGGIYTIMVENISDSDLRIYVLPNFDSMTQQEADVFRRGVFGENGCPR